MKYTIELTNKQKAQMDCIMEIVHRYIGFNPKLEPIENIWESELDKHRQQAYDKALEDLSHAMKAYFPLNSKERLDYFGTNIQTERYAIESPKDLIAMAKAYEKKKKAEEVENYHILVDTLRTVTEEYPKETIVSALSEFGFEVDKLRGEE